MSVVGIFFIAVNRKIFQRIILSLVGFSAGALIGGAFLHLIPEAIGDCDCNYIFFYVILGIALFFLLERILHWHHCHEGVCDVHTFTYMNLFGDGLHNFIDGLVILTAFKLSYSLGLTTTLMVITHELPQEIGDYAVLIHGGFSRVKALSYNFLSALTAILGALVGYFLFPLIGKLSEFLLPFAAGGFIYIAMSDLVPELHKEKDLSKSLVHFGLFSLGIGFMILVKIIGE
ncbi:ZIP family metal transporter [Candidatus Woesearchaeota archaeon]|nr:ZIP family metal transporter [Candidatus Woesearchaeota archaeon]